MNKKVLIIAREGIIREDVQNIVTVLRSLDVEYFFTPHKEALDAFKRCNPDTI